MSSLVHHVVRRGLEAAHEQYQQVYNHKYYGLQIGTLDDDETFTAKEPKKLPFKMPVWGGLVLLTTIIAYFLIMFAVRYTLELLLTTLATVETPSYSPIALPPTSARVPLLAEDTKDDSTKADTDLALVKNKPITAKIRSSLRHLKAVAGPWSRFRGVHVAVIYAISYQLLHTWLLALFPSNLLDSPYAAVPAIATHMILARFSTTWTHRVISLPVDRPWYRRLVSRAIFKKVLLPTAAWATAEQVAIYFPQTLYYRLHLHNVTVDPPSFWGFDQARQRTVILQSWLVVFVGVALTFLVVIPVQATLVRVQASTLSEDDEPIVPFDRTFGGKVVPESEGGRGVVGMLDAWRSFEWNSRLRLVRLYVKIIGIQIVTTVAFVVLLVTEMRMILGKKQFDEAVRSMGHQEEGGFFYGVCTRCRGL